ncbi:biotin/lipoyl-binding protein [Aquimarina sp. ERC-38]|uniref:biotin/lipoyl-containing protein n=1 Tax=Aquimarina sp. ERC-38 TaxID=2949996 RepID=UPI002247351D|nr:biotin/lipoyl-containing protein [Aquimarina sp. ERC-38]UZO79927.1 biotin/lipoyl-binding protein [Aquimarina sp. ERC-38]
MQRYKAKVDNLIDFEITESDVSILNIVQQSTTQYHILQDAKKWKASVQKSDFANKKYTIRVNNTDYKVQLSDELDMFIDGMGLSVVNNTNINSVPAPMPGLVLVVQVKAGQAVNKGDTLVILEAMKMENSITAPKAGVLKNIFVANGDAIEKGKILVEFE